MAHWKSMTDHRYLCAGDLNGRDVTVTISKVEAGTLEGEKGRKAKKPFCYFKGSEKPLALNVTNCKTLTRLFGSPNTDDWQGKRITLFPTMTQGPTGEEVECVRIRPKIPAERVNGKAEPPLNESTQDAPPEQASAEQPS